MTTIALIFAFALGYSIGAITLAAFSSRAYSKGYGDGFNAAQDRFTRPVVPVSEEVLAERERRGR